MKSLRVAVPAAPRTSVAIVSPARGSVATAAWIAERHREQRRNRVAARRAASTASA